MPKVLIAGATGAIGRQMTNFFLEKGWKVRVLTRQRNIRTVIDTRYWNPDSGELDPAVFEGVELVVNLCGSSIGAGKWNNETKASIIESRLKSSALLVKTMDDKGLYPSVMVQMSAEGYYGTENSAKFHKEDEGPGKGFLAEVCNKWENIPKKLENEEVRIVLIRTGVVLTPQGGILSRLIPWVKSGFASYFGDGSNTMNWLHHRDLSRFVLHAYQTNEISGAYNLVSPKSCSQKQFMQTLARVCRKWFFMPGVSKKIIQLIFGEMSLLLLNGINLSDEKMKKSGFIFHFASLEKALLDIRKDRL